MANGTACQGPAHGIKHQNAIHILEVRIKTANDSKQQWPETMCVTKSQYHQASTFRELFLNCEFDASLGSISCDKSLSILLTDYISIAFRRTIRGLWPLYAWLIDCLSPSTCHGPGWKRHIVLVTYQSLCIHSPVRLFACAKDKEDMCGYTDT